MKLIETRTLGTAAGAIEFTSIPQNFTDLQVLISGRSTNASNVNNGIIQFNGVGGTSYASRRLFGNSGAVNSEAITNNDSVFQISQNGANTTANTFSISTIYIPNYRVSAAKSFSVNSVTENKSATQGVIQTVMLIGLFNNTAAITSIRLTTDNNWAANTTVSLYGITSGSDGITTVS
jgi:hypothetical protein